MPNMINQRLASLGFHRIGRTDGTRSLWLREERDAIELRAGRDGEDESVRIEDGHPLYQQIRAVMAAARFAAEHEDGGSGLLSSFALDSHPDSIHMRRDD